MSHTFVSFTVPLQAVSVSGSRNLNTRQTMAGFIQNIIWNSVEGFVEAGKKSAGEYAGNALIKAGDMIENGGRSVGNGT